MRDFYDAKILISIYATAPINEKTAVAFMTQENNGRSSRGFGSGIEVDISVSVIEGVGVDEGVGERSCVGLETGMGLAGQLNRLDRGLVSWQDGDGYEKIGVAVRDCFGMYAFIRS